MADKVKGFMKKMSLSSSSRGKFQGQGRILGSGSTTAAGAAAAASSSRPSPPPSRPPPPSLPPISASPSPSSPPSSNLQENPSAFSPFDPLITSSAARSPAAAAPTFDCPACSLAFPSEDAVSIHLDECLGGDPSATPTAGVVECLSAFTAGKPSKDSVEVVLKLLRNVVRDPVNEKFRRIRMGNPKIKEAIGDTIGGVDVLECAGFTLAEDAGDVWATMEEPSQEQLRVIEEMVRLLESWKPLDGSAPSSSSAAKGEVIALVEEKRVDRKVRVFLPDIEGVPTKIDMPDSFYKLSADEIKREAFQRRKKIEESQILVTKSYREKQAIAAKRRYSSTTIRIQFPDRVVIEGHFLPCEATTALYEFVSSSLRDPAIEFVLLLPAVPKPQVIPRFSEAGGRLPTLERLGLVPSALLKFRPNESNSIPFTGLLEDLLHAGEPMPTSATT